jgi:hypothetical protein
VPGESLVNRLEQVVAAHAAEVYKDPRCGIRMVGGSGSIAHAFQQYRELGAETRAMLVAVTAEQRKVPANQCRPEPSVVHGPGGGRRSTAIRADAAAHVHSPELLMSLLHDALRCWRNIASPTISAVPSTFRSLVPCGANLLHRRSPLSLALRLGAYGIPSETGFLIPSVNDTSP